MIKEDFIVEEKITLYLEKLAGKAPAPGGGAASALTGAQGAALLSMVTNLTIGKKRYEHLEEHNIMMREKALEVMRMLTERVDRDKEAYLKVSAAYKLPKETDEEKTIRKKAVSDAAIIAGKVPLETMEAGVAGLEIALNLVGKSNPNLVDDIYVGTVLLKACVDGAKGNVEANISLILDSSLAEEMEEQCKFLVDKSESICKCIMSELDK